MLYLETSWRTSGNGIRSHGVEAKFHGAGFMTEPGNRDTELKEPVVQLGDLYITSNDFCELFLEFMTSLDLQTNDPRITLQQTISDLLLISGHNPHAGRKFQLAA